MLTDTEIIKALEMCAERIICLVPYEDNGTQFYQLSVGYILDLINRLQAQNDELFETADYRLVQILKLEDNLKTANAENERLKKGWKADVTLIADTKAEAYKEFAERIHCHCQSIINQEWNKKVAPVSWADAYEQFDNETDDLLNELVGENNG